ncbi:hypothetical protein DFH07DRAFT_735706 [Mycena maculata]|uniref:Uncharacterized protein n=1 Tax=Mycena maculata TaxID=230809 RepID=A0AAD7JTI7_9AGAR|nr:hypothetical protein DFH07DRAFT_735706 [Mycena maculata]
MQVDFGRRVGKLPQEVLNQTYFLHLLATEPETVIPHGKNLLSMMSRLKPPTEQPNTLHDRVEKAMKDAFWSQALASLSDPTPSIQLDRLKGLLSDVREAISPLFPPAHLILATLSAPVPPTASPLVSTTLLLKEILVALRQRAAPVRDPIIDGLLADLDAPLSPITATGPSSSIKTSTSQLAMLIISTIKSIVSLAETMKGDLNSFVVGSMTETQLKDIIVQQAKTREKELVLDIWGDSGEDASQRVKVLWQTWVDELDGQASETEPKDRWIRRLVQSFGSTHAVSCAIPDDDPLPDGPVNNLPPQFFFSTPRLLYVQNYLQALVAAAALRSLTRLPLLTQNDTRGHDFMERVWSLLKSEIDDEDPAASTTKIINFADEVVRARRLVSSPDEHEEAQLRAAVDRTLKYGDPVFLLLQKRLLMALAHQLCEPQLPTDPVSNHAPERMQTGRILGERAGKRPRLVSETTSSHVMPPVKGFEDPVLVSGIEEALTKLYRHIRWVNDVWNLD